MVQTESTRTKYKRSKYKAKEQTIDGRSFRNSDDKTKFLRENEWTELYWSLLTKMTGSQFSNAVESW